MAGLEVLALLIRGQKIAVVMPRLDASAVARVSVAGPIAGVAACTLWTGAWLSVGNPFAIGAGAILATAQMLGLKPLTKDGRALLGALDKDPPSRDPSH